MIRRFLTVFVLSLSMLPAAASFHLWTMNEVYSNADGTVQYLELTALTGGQQFLAGHTLRSSNGTTTNSFSFTTNLPGDSTGKRMLLATQGFASLGLVTPDFIIPAGFIFPSGGTITFAEGADAWAHGALPSGGVLSLNRNGSTATNSPTNFAGASGSIAPVVTSTVAANPPSFDFGGQSMRTTSIAQAIVFTNGGSAPVTGITVFVSAPFTVTHNCSTLAVGASCTATVMFTPTTEGSASANLLFQGSVSAQAALSGNGEKSLVTHYYRSILRRAPDSPGKAFWNSEATRVQALGANVNEVWFALAGTFFTSSEYLGQNRDNAGFVTDLYNTFFNRAPDSAGFASWTSLLASGMPREVVLASFMFSAEFGSFTQAIFGAATTRKEVDTVVDFYRGLLGRLPDDGGFAFWLQRFRTAQCQGASAVTAQGESISSLYATSAEYTARNRTNSQYVGDLYNAFLRRGGDLEGVQFWIGQLSTGARTRENVRQQFVASPEFSTRVTGVIQQGCLS